MSRHLARLLLAVGLTLGLVGLPAVAHADVTRAQDNISVAENTRDGSSLFDLAFSIKRITGDVVDQTNAAVAYASCEDCQTVAVAIQVLLVTGDPEVVSPTNVAVAVNESCTSCETMALAFQIVLGTDGPVRFTKEGRRRLAVLRRRLHTLTKGELTLAEINAEVQAVVTELKDILATQLVPVPPRHDDDDDDDDERDDDRDGERSRTPAPTVSSSSSVAPSASPTSSSTPKDSPSSEPIVSASS